MPNDIYASRSVLNATNLKWLYQKYSGPVWAYESDTIIDRVNQLRQFDVIRFAQKACSNIHILQLIRSQGVKVDSVSLGEIERALLAGFRPKEDDHAIIFTSDLIDSETLTRVVQLGIPVNAGSIDMLKQLGSCSPGYKVWLRINPGFGNGHSQKTNTGGENSKHGIWYTDVLLALDYVRRYHLQLIGFHMHIGSGVNYAHLSRVCDAMVHQVLSCDQDIMSISAGGGLPVSYREGEETLDINNYFKIWDKARQCISQHLGHPINLEIEPGRFLVAEAGVLIAQVRAVKEVSHRYFVLVDVGFNDLLRPVMYGSYHHISLLPSDNRDIRTEPLRDTIVGGPLCESGDIFTQNSIGEIVPRKLPQAKVGDYIIFHDTGAYGSSMSSNYNTRPFIPEVLFDKGTIRQIRRRQRFEELFLLEEMKIIAHE